MQLKGKKIALFVEQLYEDQEYWYPYFRLKEEGADVVTVAPKANQVYPSKHGYKAHSDKAAAEVSAKDFDGLVIPGGYAPDHMRRDPAMVRFTKEAVQGKKVVAAICHGGWMLCSAGALKGRKVTSFSAIRDDMTNAGADWVDQEVVKDGHLITSRRPEDLPAFLRTFIGTLVES